MKTLRLLLPVLSLAASAHAQVGVISMRRAMRAAASISTVADRDFQSLRAAGTLPGVFEESLVASAASDSGPDSQGFVGGFATQSSNIAPYLFSGSFSGGVHATGVGFAYSVAASSSLDVTFMASRPLGWIARTSQEGLPGACGARLIRNDTKATIGLGPLGFGELAQGVSYTFSASCQIEQVGAVEFLGFNTSGSQRTSFMLFADECASAIEVWGPGPFPFDNALAESSGPDEALCEDKGSAAFGHDVWYRWRSTCPGSIRISTCGSTSIDSKIAVYVDGCPGATGTLRGCNDDSCGTLQTTLRTYSLRGRDYLIRVGTFSGAAGGEGAFTITCCPCDFDGTGTIDGSDFFAFTTALFAGFSDADYNGDSVVDTADFFAFSSCFFASSPTCD